MQSRKALVTGGAGLIGSELVKQLLEEGIQVRVVDNCSRGNTANLADVLGKIQFMPMDLTRYHNCEIACQGMDDVYHLAAVLGGVGFITRHPATAGTGNYLMNINMLKAAKNFGISRFMFTSTACIYPTQLQENPNDPPLKEEDWKPFNPESTYGWAKLATELMCEAYREEFNMNFAIVRMFNVYGPGENFEGEDSHVIPMLIRKAINYPDEDYLVWGTGKATRSFLYVSDAAKGIRSTMDKGLNQGPINIGSDKRWTIKELAEMIKDVVGKPDMGIVFDRWKPEGVVGRAADWKKAEQLLGWSPKVDLRSGLVLTKEWMESVIKQ